MSLVMFELLVVYVEIDNFEFIFDTDDTIFACGL